ncbi:MAG: response regulator [Nanoarchaeota archaeon]
MKKILIVGPCCADAKALTKFLESTFKVQTTDLTKIKEATDFLKQRNYDLILVSRVLRGANQSGLELVAHVKKHCPSKPIIMLTRFQEAQEEALKHGAAAAFDMDLLIGYIRPSMKEKQEKALNVLKKYLG